MFINLFIYLFLNKYLFKINIINKKKTSRNNK